MMRAPWYGVVVAATAFLSGGSALAEDKGNSCGTGEKERLESTIPIREPAREVLAALEPEQQDIKEREGARLAKVWRSRREKPAPGEDGVVIIPFGAALPTVVCAPLYVCDIALQQGEKILETNLGDSVRWKVAPITGPGGTPHIVIKPIDSGLRTNLLITTNRRTYPIQLVARRRDWMPLTAFSYPEEAHRQWGGSGPEDRKAAGPFSGASIAELDFGYEVQVEKGRPNWRPVRVYNDGLKTYVQFPAAMQTSEAPVLVALGNGDKEQVVNYRVHGDRYVVDRLFDKAILIAGVGKHQEKVEIERRPSMHAQTERH